MSYTPFAVAPAPSLTGGGAGVTAHGDLTGLDADDHPLYKLNVVKWDTASKGDSNITLPSTGGAWADVSTALDLSVPAAVGDLLQIDLNFMRSNTGNAFYDVAIINGGGTPIRYLSSGTGTPELEGIPGLYPNPANFIGCSSGLYIVAESGDIVSGAVAVRLRYRHNGGTAATLYSDSNYPFNWHMVNLGAGS